MGSDEELRRDKLREEYLPRLLKMRILHDVVIIIPRPYPDPVERISLSKGSEVTRIDPCPCLVATEDGVRCGMSVRIHKLNSADDNQRLLQRVLVVPADALEIHPDQL